MLSFLDKVQKNEVQKNDLNGSFFCFVGKAYPLLFFSFVLAKINNSIRVEQVDVDDIDKNELLSKLESSFLGQKTFYWLGCLDAKNKEFWCKYGDKYKGPNILAFFVDSYTSGIKVEDEIKSDAIDNYKKFLAIPVKDVLFEKVYQRTDAINLDTLYLLTEYSYLLGGKVNLFVDNWLEKFLLTEKSLFTLSQYFFSKNYKAFLKYWDKVYEVYPSAFWHTFWSEQLWQAYCVMDYIKKGDFINTKKIGYRLPFSFLKFDWKKTSLQELKSAHNFIYDLDFKFKHGLGEFGLDVFFSKFFLNTWS